MSFNVLAALQLMIAVALVMAIGVSLFYLWYRREERKRDNRINEKLDIF